MLGIKFNQIFISFIRRATNGLCSLGILKMMGLILSLRKRVGGEDWILDKSENSSIIRVENL
jgi:hypothetical protein